MFTELEPAFPPGSASPALRTLIVGAIVAIAGCSSGEPTPIVVADRFDVAIFRDPPREFGPHVRWWWPGGAVDDATIAAEVAVLADAGFAGIELQTLSFGLSEADLARDPRIRTVGEPTQLAHVATFLGEAKRHALRSALTMGSGWPTGGVFSSDIRPLELVRARVDVMGPAVVSIPVPTPMAPAWTAPSQLITFPIVGGFTAPFELVATLAAPIVDGAPSPPVLGTAIDVSSFVTGGSLVWEAPAGHHAIVFVFRHRVDHLVAGDAFPTVPDSAHVVNHLDADEIATWLAEQPMAWLDAVAPNAPDELFMDSFELVAELPWSDVFAARFTSELGYDVRPYLPFLFLERGESKYQSLLGAGDAPAYASSDATGARVREDYEDVRGRLFADSIIAPSAAFASAHGAALRLQAHGGYAHVLDAYALADIPESESLFAQGSMDFLELAASAAHVAGRELVSSETFPVVSFIGPTLTEEEMWMIAGRAFTAGIQRLVYHGVAYPYERANGARWFPFAAPDEAEPTTAGPTDFTNDIRPGEPGWAFLPAFNRAMQRLGYAMTRGVDRAEVAWLLDEREVPDAALLRVLDLPPEQGESETSLALRRAGFGYDRISPRSLAASTTEGGTLHVGAARYRALLITDWPSANPDELDAVERALDAGIPVVVLGAMPSRARGLSDAAARDGLVTTTMAAIDARLRRVEDPAAIASALVDANVVPDVTIVRSTCPIVSLAHREVANGDVFYVFNEGGTACEATFDFHVEGARISILDPLTGSDRRATRGRAVALAPRRPIIVFVEH